MMLWIAWVALTLRRSVARVQARSHRARLAARPRASSQRVAPPRTASEGPLDYAQRIAAARPDLAAPVAALAARYARLRFGPAADARRSDARWNAKSGSWRCEPHAPQQHATDHEQQHQRDDRDARSLCVSAATTAMSSGPSTVANLPIML